MSVWQMLAGRQAGSAPSGVTSAFPCAAILCSVWRRCQKNECHPRPLSCSRSFLFDFCLRQNGPSECQTLLQSLGGEAPPAMSFSGLGQQPRDSVGRHTPPSAQHKAGAPAGSALCVQTAPGLQAPWSGTWITAFHTTGPQSQKSLRRDRGRHLH